MASLAACSGDDGGGPTGDDGPTPDGPVQEASDTVAPALVIGAPRDGVAVDERAITVSGTASDNGELVSVTYEANGEAGEAVTVEADGTYAFTFTPVPGPNSFVIRARDAAGNETTTERAVYFGHRVSCGNSQSALLANDTLYTWGRNELGQLGTGALVGTWSSNAAIAATLPAMYEQPANGLVSIVTRQTTMIGLVNDGTVKTWGANGSGQLGYTTPLDCGTAGTSACGRTPQAVPGITDAVAVAAGFDHALVLRADGTVLSFGGNLKGQLGRVTADLAAQTTPAAVTGLSNVIAIGAGAAHSMALTADGTVFIWGDNSEGQLGTGASDTTAHATPTQVAGLVGAGIASANYTVYVRKPDGTVVAWGQNQNGQVGANVPTTTRTVLAPTPVLASDGTPLQNIASIAGDGFVGMALDHSGVSYTWGWGFLGQLGQGNLGDGERDLANRLVASKVYVAPGDEAAFDALEIEVGAGGPAFAWTTQSKLLGWGWSFQGSLGGGTAFTNAWAYSTPLLVYPQPPPQ